MLRNKKDCRLITVVVKIKIKNFNFYKFVSEDAFQRGFVQQISHKLQILLQSFVTIAIDNTKNYVSTKWS